eukprot:scaffold297599_cov33-Tisochrysis_lutea.AAC.3
MAPLQIVGLTGGIACGKSAVSAVASSLGLRVIDMDEISRRVVRRGLPAHAAIVKAFGTQVLRPDGELDRAALGQLVFADRQKRRALNSATHRPMLIQLLAELDDAMSCGERAVLIDAPLLFETGLHWLCAFIIVVSLSEATQLERLQRRDGFSEEEARRRVASQMPLTLKVARADTVIDNEADLHVLRQQAMSALRAAGAVPGQGDGARIVRLPRTRSRVVDVVLWLVLAVVRVAGVTPLPQANL